MVYRSADAPLKKKILVVYLWDATRYGVAQTARDSTSSANRINWSTTTCGGFVVEAKIRWTRVRGQRWTGVIFAFFFSLHLPKTVGGTKFNSWFSIQLQLHDIRVPRQRIVTAQNKYLKLKIKSKHNKFELPAKFHHRKTNLRFLIFFSNVRWKTKSPLIGFNHKTSKIYHFLRSILKLIEIINFLVNSPRTRDFS